MKAHSTSSSTRRRRCLAPLARQLRPAEQMEAVQREATVLCSTSPSSSLPSLSPRVPHRSQRQGRRPRQGTRLNAPPGYNSRFKSPGSGHAASLRESLGGWRDRRVVMQAMICRLVICPPGGRAMMPPCVYRHTYPSFQNACWKIF